MKLASCKKCQNDLPFSTASEVIVCLFCGEEHYFENAKYRHHKASPSSNNHDVSAVTVILGSDGDV